MTVVQFQQTFQPGKRITDHNMKHAVQETASQCFLEKIKIFI